MKKINIQKAFINSLNFSKKNIFNRLLENPIETIYKVIFSKIYNIFLKEKVIIKKGKTFWGDKMLMVLPEDLSLFHFKLVPGEEEKLTGFIINNIKKDWVVVDIGANHGYYTLLLSELVGPNGKVYSFEPTPSTVDILEKNIKNKNNIIIEQKATWLENTILDFTDFGQGFSSYNSLLSKTNWKEQLKKEFSKIKVTAMKLEDYFRESKITPSFIKLDVEGAELESLKGMRNFLYNNSIIISVEFWVNKLYNAKNEEIINFMKKIEYYPFEIKNNNLIPFDNHNFEHDYINVIFCKKNDISNNPNI